MAIRIDWNRLMRTTEGERIVFEQFCHHVILCSFNDCGIEEHYYNTPGSESYILLTKSIEYHGIILSAGDIIGWQAKYWMGNDPNNSPLNSKHKKELIDGFKKAIHFKNKIKLWILCTPGSFEQKAYADLKNQFATISSECIIETWDKSKFEALYLNEQEKYNGIYHYYFDGRFLGKQAIDSVSKDTLEKQKNKYDVELHVPSDMEKQLLSVIDSKIATYTLKKKIEQVVTGIRNDLKYNGMLCEENLHHTQFSTKYIQIYNNELTNRITLADSLVSCLENANLLVQVPVLLQQIEQFINQRKVNIDDINRELKHIVERTKDKKLSTYTSMIFENHRERIYLIDKLVFEPQSGILNLDQALKLISKKIHSIFAEPGFGKTHFACSIATNLMIKNSFPVLFLLGRDFSKDKPLVDILTKKLNLASNPNLDDIMDMLDFLGEHYKCRLPIIIDGLNEADPHTNRWRDDLAELGRRVHERNNLLLITTCRSQKDYIRVIYNHDKVTDIENSYELSGIESYDVKNAVKKYFAKYGIKPNPHPNLSEFQHPLLLKIFCTVNAGKQNFDIYGTSLTESMQKYSEQIIEIVANKEHPDYELRKFEIRKGLRNYAQTIWTSNNRDMLYVPDFFKNFLQNEYARGIIDEGCCTSEMIETESYVHFTYDMIAGYHIAEQIIATYPNKIDFVSYVYTKMSKLFGEERHIYGQDIVKSLVFLVPQKYGEHWSSLMPCSETIAATFDGLDGVLASATGIKTLRTIITNNADNSNIKEQLCEKIYCRVCIEHNLSHFKEFLPLFIAMQPTEIDQYWNSRFVTYSQMRDIQVFLHDDYVLEMYEWDDVVSFNIVMCGIMDKEFHEIYHKQLFSHILSHYDDISYDIFTESLKISDTYIFESIVTALAGVGLRSEERDRYDIIVEVFEKYMLEYTSNCVLLLDALETLYSYGKYKWGIVHDRSILSKNKSEIWQIIPYREADLFSLYNYDFDKFNIRPLYSPTYYSTFSVKKLSKSDVYGMLLARCRQNGYNEGVCLQLNKDAYEKAKYRNTKFVNYGEKYGRFALMELYGWLILNGYINPAYKDTFRVEILDVDLSMPHFLKKRSLVSKSLMPQKLDDLGEWIEKDDSYFMEELFICRFPRYDGEWVMLQGRFKQEISDKYATYYMSGHAELADENMSDEAISKMQLVDSIDTNHLYGAEIGWRKLESREGDESLEQERRLLGYYGYSNWSESRYDYRSFEYLHTMWAVKLGLRFDVNTMAYYDRNGHEASIYFVNDSDLFFYLRKDIVDTILKETNSCLRFHIYERRMVSSSLPKERDVYVKKFEQRERDVIYRIKH